VGDELELLDVYGAAPSGSPARPAREVRPRSVVAVVGAILLVVTGVTAARLLWPDPPRPAPTALVLPTWLPGDLALTDVVRAADGATLRAPWDVRRAGFVDPDHPGRIVQVAWRDREDRGAIPDGSTPVALTGGREGWRYGDGATVSFGAVTSDRSLIVRGRAVADEVLRDALDAALAGDPAAPPPGFVPLAGSDRADAALTVTARSRTGEREVTLRVFSTGGLPPGARDVRVVGREVLVVDDALVVVLTSGLTANERALVVAGVRRVDDRAWELALLRAGLPPGAVEQQDVGSGRLRTGDLAGRTWSLVERRRDGGTWCPALGIDSFVGVAAGAVCSTGTATMAGRLFAGGLPDGAQPVTVRFSTRLGEVDTDATVVEGPSGNRYVVAEGPTGDDLLVGTPVVFDAAGRTIPLRGL
jgi:hypothetical protein